MAGREKSPDHEKEDTGILDNGHFHQVSAKLKEKGREIAFAV
jgi:hypothetical protein